MGVGYGVRFAFEPRCSQKAYPRDCNEEEYNVWVKKLAQEQAEEGQPIVLVRIKEIAPVRSRLVSPTLQPAERA
ncbi:MAG: DUF5647 family protein [bacterium]